MRQMLILCLGNICRSPMAEALMRAELNSPDWQISSAGLRALVGHAPDALAQEVILTKRGIDISQHRAQQVTSEMLLNTEFILVMDRKQQQELRNHFPIIKGKVLRLGEFSGFDIPDPYKRPRLAFEQTFLLIEKSCNDWAKNLK